MMFRTRLLVILTIAIVAAIGLVELLVQGTTRRAFERVEAQHASALAAQFQKEFQRRGLEIVRAVNAIADSEEGSNLAMNGADYESATKLAASHGLDLLELVAPDGKIVSSAEWPARFDYHEDWITAPVDWKQRGAFLRREELPQGFGLSLVAVAVAKAGDRRLYVTGGQQLDREFLSTLVLPAGMRVLLYRNLAAGFEPAELIEANGPVREAAGLRPLIEQARSGTREIAGTAGIENVRAVPLPDDQNHVAGV